MQTNCGATSLKRRRRKADPMRIFDELPAELRAWVAAADLPWSPHSVRRIYHRALARTQDKACALEELNRMQRRQITRDARKIWGADHPGATAEPRP